MVTGLHRSYVRPPSFIFIIPREVHCLHAAVHLYEKKQLKAVSDSQTRRGNFSAKKSKMSNKRPAFHRIRRCMWRNEGHRGTAMVSVLPSTPYTTQTFCREIGNYSLRNSRWTAYPFIYKASLARHLIHPIPPRSTLNTPEPPCT